MLLMRTHTHSLLFSYSIRHNILTPCYLTSMDCEHIANVAIYFCWKFAICHTCQGYPGYFREPNWKSMGLPEIYRVTWQVWPVCWQMLMTRYETKLIWIKQSIIYFKSPVGLLYPHFNMVCHARAKWTKVILLRKSGGTPSQIDV